MENNEVREYLEKDIDNSIAKLIKIKESLLDFLVANKESFSGYTIELKYGDKGTLPEFNIKIAGMVLNLKEQ